MPPPRRSASLRSRRREALHALRPRPRHPLRAARGQATVEFVVLLPVLATLALGVWQVAVAGHAVWAAGAAARAAARAEAVGGDTERAALRLLPARVRRAAEVRAGSDGEVRVDVPIPTVVGGGSLFTVTGRARFAPQR